MARADFYILNGSTTATRFSCSIASKALSQDQSIFIMTRDTEAAAKMDDLLWTYQDISFLPHKKVDDEDNEAPVMIGWPGAIPPDANVIINLTDSIPDCVDRYQRIIEIIPEDPQHREKGRERYKGYRDMGFEMFNHEINLDQ